MDPLSQGALGAALSLAVLPRGGPLRPRAVAWLGAAGGMAADLDVLIRSPDDPLLAILFHRHFTHSLAFIPVGGLLVAGALLALPSLRPHRLWVALATTLGYATHGILDAFTTYGTQLYWPFSSERIALSWVSVVDPLVTLPLLAAVILAVRRGERQPALAGLFWCAMVLGGGAIQQARALDVQLSLAKLRGHSPTREAVFPTFANNVTWRSLYEAGGHFYVDKIRVPWVGRACATPGSRVPVPEPWNDPRSVHARAERLLRWFASDWVSVAPGDPDVLGDLRYSFEPATAAPIWGIRRHADEDRVDWVNNRMQRAITWADLEQLVLSDGPDARCF